MADELKIVEGAPLPEIKEWLEEISSAKKRHKDWLKSADDLVKLYECTDKKENSFNIFYSNTETLAPALYNNLPRPTVKRRFDDKDMPGKVASEVVRRMLEFLLDNEVENYTPFDTLMESSVLHALVPGRGVVWFKYEAELEEVEAEEETEVEEPVEGAEYSMPEGEVEDDEPEARVLWETACGELVPYNQFYMGYAKAWKDVPWVGRDHFLTREECIKFFGEVGKLVPLTVTPSDKATSDEDLSDRSDKLVDAQGTKLAHVYEVWDKDKRQVIFFCRALPQRFLKKVDDPLGLSDFFPLPEPLQFFNKISSMVPQTLYSAYEEQAKELNRVTLRINKLIAALKVRGFYDNTIEGLGDLLGSEENQLLPAENVAALQDKGGLEKAIWMFPVKDIIPVLQQLYAQRNQVKQVIYEITGISDILRGSTVASETATAQDIKNQWGTLRLKKWQKRVQKYVRSCLRVLAEIGCKKFSIETLAAITNLQYPTAAQKSQAQMIMSQLQVQMTEIQQVIQTQPEAAQQLQPTLQSMQQQAGPLQEILAKPTWEDIQALLSNDLTRNYRIDIETNSTVDIEATEDKQSIGEFMNALAQFLNGVGPLVQQGTLPFPAAKSMLMAIVRKYRFGVEVEQEIEAMQPPQPQGEDPAQKMELQKLEMETKASAQESSTKLKLMEEEAQLKREEFAMKRQELKDKAEYNQAQHQMRMQELAAKALMPQQSNPQRGR